uniref:Uncharacterized protein n=1 Tax=Meleagris gallopavo TaxID=9103 RepID=A0A803YBD4_MELGA
MCLNQPPSCFGAVHPPAALLGLTPHTSPPATTPGTEPHAEQRAARNREAQTLRYRVRRPSGSAAGASSLARRRPSEKPSARATARVALAERGGRPRSRTSTTSLCRAASRSPTARAVRTSPLCSPTRNSPGSVALASS